MLLRSLIAVSILAAPLVAMEPVRMGLVLATETEIPASVLSSMRTETAKTLALDEISLEWRTVGTLSEDETFDRVVVVRLTGECSPSRAALKQKGPLGVTHVAEGRILPFVGADCGRVMQALGRLPAAAHRAIRDHDFGRALARVIAHELYHVISGRHDHSHEGIAKEFLNAPELVQSSLHFSTESMASIRHGLSRLGSVADVSRPDTR